MSIERKSLEFELKSLGEAGSFAGYLAAFGNVDSYGDIIKKGAFKASIKAIAASGRKLPILWQHSWDKPIGIFTSLREDDAGLYVEGQLLIGDVAQAKEAYALLKSQAISGMSIGFETVAQRDNEDGTRTLTELKLWEGSLVTFPANDAARVDSVKAALSDGGLPTLPEFEKFLREAGFSKTQATAIASGGLSKLLRSESAEKTAADAELKAALETLQSIRAQ